jgi:hypothetical protein
MSPHTVLGSTPPASPSSATSLGSRLGHLSLCVLSPFPLSLISSPLTLRSADWLPDLHRYHPCRLSNLLHVRSLPAFLRPHHLSTLSCFFFLCFRLTIADALSSPSSRLSAGESGSYPTAKPTSSASSLSLRPRPDWHCELSFLLRFSPS